jgi:hypothetical protein
VTVASPVSSTLLNSPRGDRCAGLLSPPPLRGGEGDTHLRGIPGCGGLLPLSEESRTSEWEAVRARARVEVQRLRSLPRPDAWAQVKEGTWSQPTEEQRRVARLMEDA